jgi:hypothetical protein
MTKAELIAELREYAGVEEIDVRPNQTVEIAVCDGASYPYDKINDGPCIILRIHLDKQPEV